MSELLDWLNKMYEILGSQPPLPEELTTEDFDMFFGDSWEVKKNQMI